MGAQERLFDESRERIAGCCAALEAAIDSGSGLLTDQDGRNAAAECRRLAQSIRMRLYAVDAIMERRMSGPEL